MAAVMIGGMVPPIAIALATTFFKHKFTAQERKAGTVNYIMGLCFITEGRDYLLQRPDPLSGHTVMCRRFGTGRRYIHGDGMYA